ncbi:hypothetical protein PR048_017933 [Dryococelus australis]|uniref:Uncharacterized protein n=1 Tax=Dryococelus australis TaxID=614101 RepID=A0ABQ9HB03_9NEOP|nr:hypothetical protein PR048_017933 [Dryococelus australis]
MQSSSEFVTRAVVCCIRIPGLESREGKDMCSVAGVPGPKRIARGKRKTRRIEQKFLWSATAADNRKEKVTEVVEDGVPGRICKSKLEVASSGRACARGKRRPQVPRQWERKRERERDKEMDKIDGKRVGQCRGRGESEIESRTLDRKLPAVYGSVYDDFPLTWALGRKKARWCQYRRRLVTRRNLVANVGSGTNAPLIEASLSAWLHATRSAVAMDKLSTRVKRREYRTAPEFKGGRKREIPKKTRRPAASSGTIPTYENPGVTPPGIEPGLSRGETSSLATTPPWPLISLNNLCADKYKSRRCVAFSEIFYGYTRKWRFRENEERCSLRELVPTASSLPVLFQEIVPTRTPSFPSSVKSQGLV